MPVLTDHDRRFLAMSWALGMIQKRLNRVLALTGAKVLTSESDLQNELAEIYILASSTTSELWALREAHQRARKTSDS